MFITSDEVKAEMERQLGEDSIWSKQWKASGVTGREGCGGSTKNVILLSTMHDEGEINSASQKSEIVDFYNLVREGVDVFGKPCHFYFTKRL